MACLRFDVSGIVEAVAEIDDGVERDQALGIEHGAHAIGDELMHALAFGADLHRAGEKLDDLILREFGLVGGGHRDFFERGAAGIEGLRGRVDLAPRLENFLERSVEVFAADFVLAGEDLPDADGRLEGSHGVAAQRLIVDGVERGDGVGESGDGGVVELGKFGEEEILIAEFGEFRGDELHGIGRKLFVGRAAAVEVAHQ